MAFFRESAREAYLKIHYENYGVKRVSPLSVELSELASYIGLKSAICSEIKCIGRMSGAVFAYRDYVDLTERHYTRFLDFISSSDSSVNVKVFENAIVPNSHATPQGDSDLQPTVQEDTSNIFENFVYKTPIEHSMNSLKQEILELEVQSESAADHLQNLKNKFCGNAVPSFGKQCSNCHLKLEYNARQCRLEKCISSQQCGDISKHQEERAPLESANDFFEKNTKRTKSKTIEYDTKLKASESVKNSFSEKIRCHLINSNKPKYLLKISDDSFLPRSGIVNCDIAKLEKYYQGKCPENLGLASNLFGTIISNFDKQHTNKFSTSERNNPAKRILEENTIFPVKFPRRVPSSTHPNPESDYQNKADVPHLPLKKR